MGDDEGDHRGLANAGATTPSPRGKGKKAKGAWVGWLVRKCGCNPLVNGVSLGIGTY